MKSSLKISNEQLALAANTLRMLSAEAVEKANAGHPGMPMGMADLAAVLWLKYLSHQPQDLKWLNRDRFVLSNGHGCALLYSLMHLSGYSLTLDDLKSFRQWDSKTPGHPETHITPGVEATTGPLGQGISNSVGMLIGRNLLQSKYSDLPLDHKVFVFAGDGCMMEGVSSEASSVAGHLGLEGLIVIYDDNHISIAGSTKLAFTEDVVKRYESYGWHTLRVDGHDYAAIEKALDEAIQVKGKPVLIAARTIIGKGAPHKANDSEVHGSPLGKDEMLATKKALNWPLDKEFYITEEVQALFAKRSEEIKSNYENWSGKFKEWKEKNSDAAKLLEAQRSLAAPADMYKKLIEALPKDGKAIATRKLSQTVLQVVSREVPSLIGGSADLEPSTFTLINGSSDIEKEEFKGLNLRFGVREHGMGAIMNGLSYYGSYIPYGSTFLTFSDYMRPTLRLAAISHLQGLFIFTHDSIFLGEDGPTHQPIEHLNSLRMIPNLYVIRPADALETAAAYQMALDRKDGPSALIFSRQNLEQIERAATFNPEEILKGAYVAFERGGADVVIVATGSEVSLAIQSAKKLPENVKVRVVSMPCYEAYKIQTKEYKEKLIPTGSKKVTLEAGVTIGWSEMVGGGNTLAIGIDRFGASAPFKALTQGFGFTPEAVSEKIIKFI
jgi:transketolase